MSSSFFKFFSCIFSFILILILIFIIPIYFFNNNIELIVNTNKEQTLKVLEGTFSWPTPRIYTNYIKFRL